MKFDLPITPPTTTAQEKRLTTVDGRPVFYDPPKIKAAKSLFITSLIPRRPKEPFTGAVKLSVIWRFPRGRRHGEGEYKTTRPDTDNLEKLLKDCMTKCGFWKDDALVCVENVSKIWSANPGISIEIEELI